MSAAILRLRRSLNPEMCTWGMCSTSRTLSTAHTTTRAITMGNFDTHSYSGKQSILLVILCIILIVCYTCTDERYEWRQCVCSVVGSKLVLEVGYAFFLRAHPFCHLLRSRVMFLVDIGYCCLLFWKWWVWQLWNHLWCRCYCVRWVIQIMGASWDDVVSVVLQRVECWWSVVLQVSGVSLPPLSDTD
jgi:hypothetical protein